MEKLKNLFLESFGLPIEKVIPLRNNLVAFDGKTLDDSMMVGSQIARDKTYLTEGDIKAFLESNSKDYFAIGFWGHGVNSYAFYYSRIDALSKVFFRLPYGGIYMDNQKQAKLIPKFLLAFFKFEQKFIGQIKEFIAIDSMDDGYYKIDLLNGKSVEVKSSLLRKPNFDQRFKKLIENFPA